MSEPDYPYPKKTDEPIETPKKRAPRDAAAYTTAVH
jgi:hypothetical protein